MVATFFSAMTFSPPQAPPVVPIANQNQPIVTTPIANQPITPDFTGTYSFNNSNQDF